MEQWAFRNDAVGRGHPATRRSTKGIDINAIGVILMPIGAIGFDPSLVFWSSWGGWRPVRRNIVVREDERPLYRERYWRFGMVWLVLLALLIAVLIGAGFVVKWLFIAATIVALIWVIAFSAAACAAPKRAC